ncbi:hypothetical protein [Desulfopila sp. IMCC35008]|uniref:hypothetical protein n=1 Tax=Desulfopila sp. IMCC35008 TaxID=2653858 RepID=UPI0013D2D152|nr:hypothetical protein [Desulfopila sp. IMCC35008]
MGFQFLDEYNTYLKRYFFLEKNVDNLGYFTRILVMPSFQKEEYLSIYQDGEVYNLLNVIPNESVWVSLQNSKQQEKDPNFPDINKIQVTKKSKQVSKDLYDAINETMWKMVMKSKYPPGNLFDVLDGSNYIFSAGLGVCAMTTGQGGENIETLIKITHMLLDYAKSDNSSFDEEMKIINISKVLNDNI